MRNAKRGRYTLGFKLEVVRLVEPDQSIAEAVGMLGALEHSLPGRVKVLRAGGRSKGSVVGARRRQSQ